MTRPRVDPGIFSGTRLALRGLAGRHGPRRRHSPASPPPDQPGGGCPLDPCERVLDLCYQWFRQPCDKQGKILSHRLHGLLSDFPGLMDTMPTLTRGYVVHIMSWAALPVPAPSLAPAPAPSLAPAPAPSLAPAPAPSLAPALVPSLAPVPAAVAPASPQPAGRSRSGFPTAR